MSDKIWYFARGDTEHGPVTAKQMKALASTGKLRGDDLVWREGMPDWALAGEVTEIFAADNGSASDPAYERLPSKSSDSTDTTAPSPPARSPKRPFAAVRDIGFYSLLGGVILAVVAKGCDMTHERYVTSVHARVSHVTALFEDEWTSKKIQLEQREQELSQQVEADANPLNRQMLQQVKDDLENWSTNKLASEQQLQTGAWADIRQASRDANLTYRSLRFWRSLVFLLGTFALVAGLATVSIRGVGPERWICLGILAIVIFSLYVGGDAWTIFTATERSP